MIEVIKTRIIDNYNISNGIYYIKLELPVSYPGSAPGQFVNLYLNNQSKLLPRPISIFDHNNNELHLVYAIVGEGTKELSSYKKNSFIKVSTPLGNGFTIPDLNHDAEDSDENNILLIGGGLGIAPLHYLAKGLFYKYRDSSVNPDVYTVLGYNDEPFLHEMFGNYCYEIQVCSESEHDDCWHGNVILPIAECEYYFRNNWFVCGPHLMEKAICEYAENIGDINIQVSMEERMGCGFGTCVGCSIDTKNTSHDIVRKKVCKDGPVFNGNEVVW